MEAQIKPLILLVTVVTVVNLLVCANGSCPENYYLNEDKCCRLCPKGTFLSFPCLEDQGSSSCEPCPPSTYMDMANNSTECLACTKCTPSKIVLVECEPTQNRKCGCPHGKFLNHHYLYCMDCLKCPVGEGAVAPCTQKSNTKCEPCPKGTFSDLESFEEKCIICTKCEPAEIMVVKEECNTSRDTICERTNLTLDLITSSQSFASTSVSLRQVPSRNGVNTPVTVKKGPAFQYIIPIVSVGFLLLVFVVAFIYCLVRRRRCSDTNDTSHPQEVSESEYHFPVPATTSGTPAQLRSSQGLRGRKSNHVRNNSQRKESESQSDNNGKNKRLVRDLPGHVYIELGRLLNPKSLNNWVKLAGLLGFTNLHVRNFELDPVEATQNLLNEWSQQDDSSVDVLVDVLKQMKREDCLQVLKEWIS